MYELFLETDKAKAKEFLEKLHEIFVKGNKLDKAAEVQVKLYEIHLDLKHYVNFSKRPILMNYSNR